MLAHEVVPGSGTGGLDGVPGMSVLHRDVDDDGTHRSGLKDESWFVWLASAGPSLVGTSRRST